MNIEDIIMDEITEACTHKFRQYPLIKQIYNTIINTIKDNYTEDDIDILISNIIDHELDEVLECE